VLGISWAGVSAETEDSFFLSTRAIPDVAGVSRVQRVAFLGPGGGMSIDFSVLVASGGPWREARIIGDCLCLLGDCLEIMPILPKIDAVITDPPYFLPAAHYNTRSKSIKTIGDLSILNYYFVSFFNVLENILSRSGCCYVFCDGQSYPVFYASAYSKFRKIRPLVWDKKTSINGFAWRHQHELILFCEQQEFPPLPTGDGDIIAVRAEPISDREHLAQKPIALLRKLVEKTSGIILDSFAGSFTTGVACVQLGRQFIGCELDPIYYQIGCRRIEEAIRQGNLFPSVAPAMSVQEPLL
jgi:site-specific DNA-methyltransferase (adenine-specific)